MEGKSNFWYFIHVLSRAIFAGAFISIAGWGFLVNPIIGMFLFCVGLIAVIKYNAGLFTGSAGSLYSFSDFLWLLVVLFGNIVGCMTIALLAKVSPFELYNAAAQIVESRLSLGWLNCGLLSIGCGMLMSFAARFARRNNDISDWLPLLFAVPTFIFCGFPHCIADAFYTSVYLTETYTSLLPVKELICYYASIVVGNFVGCNVYRIFAPID